MRRSLKALAITCIAAMQAAHAQSGVPPAFVDPEQRLARLVRIVPVDYPKVAIEKGQQGTVLVRGLIQATGELAQAAYEPDSEASSVFVAAIANVIGYWSFEPGLGTDCQPSKEPVAVSIQFEIDGEKNPRVFVTHAKDRSGNDKTLGADMGRFKATDYRALQWHQPAYPETLRTKGIEANVFTRMMVEPSGEVLNVEAKAYALIPFMAPGTNALSVTHVLEDIKATSLAPFETAAIRALSTWRFPAIEDPARRFMCLNVRYRLK